MYGDQVDKMTEYCHLSSLSERSVGRVPVVGPIWRGGIEISGKISGKLDGLEVFIPKNLQPKVLQLKQSLQKSVCFCMKSRRALWPKHFDDVGAAHSDIELFMFPEVSRSVIDYDDLVEHMISNDLAMTSHIDNFKLIIFTSLEQEDNQQHIKGKYYLWGVVKVKEYMRCKSSRGKNTNAEKKRNSKSTRALDCAKESNSPSSGRRDVSAPSVRHQPITTTQFAVRYNFVSPLSQGCKRPRSKRGRISRTFKEVGDVRKSVIADFPGMEGRDQENNGVVPVKWHQTLGKSRQAKICTNIEQVQVDNDPDSTVMKKKPVMVTDEVDNLSKKDALTSVVGGAVMNDGMTNLGSPSPNLAAEVTINTETEEAEQRSWDSNMEIDEPSDSSAINVKETEVQQRSWDSDMEIDEPTDDVVKDDVELQPQSNASQAMDAEIKACLTPFLNSEEFPVQEVPNSASVTNQNNSENMILRLNEESTRDGRCQRVARVDHLECQASDPLPEMDSCRTPVPTFEEPGPCSSSSSTLVLEVDEEEDKQETAMKGTEILRVQVGQYTIKSDLAPILTKILIKYGDIGLGCSMMPETVLETICKAFQELEQVSFTDLRSHHLDHLRNLCQLGETLEFDMKWLYDRCEDVEKKVLQISQYPFLKEELAKCNKSIESLQENVDLNRSIVAKLLEENKLMEEEVESLTEHREKLQCEIEDVRFQSKRFIGRSLVDGLF